MNVRGYEEEQQKGNKEHPDSIEMFCLHTLSGRAVVYELLIFSFFYDHIDMSVFIETGVIVSAMLDADTIFTL